MHWETADLHKPGVSLPYDPVILKNVNTGLRLPVTSNIVVLWPFISLSTVLTSLLLFSGLGVFSVFNMLLDAH